MPRRIGTDSEPTTDHRSGTQLPPNFRNRGGNCRGARAPELAGEIRRRSGRATAPVAGREVCACAGDDVPAPLIDRSLVPVCDSPLCDSDRHRRHPQRRPCAARWRGQECADRSGLIQGVTKWCAHALGHDTASRQKKPMARSARDFYAPSLNHPVPCEAVVGWPPMSRSASGASGSSQRASSEMGMFAQ